MERKTPTNDIYPVTTVNRNGIYEDIVNVLGSNNPFAKFNIGSGFYAWTDNSCHWNQMIAANDLEQSIVRNALIDLRIKLIPILGHQNVDMLFTVPDDSYIYYNYDGEEVKILITGWGFKKPVKPNGLPDLIGLSEPNPISWAFMDNGKRVPNHPFGIKIDQSTKRKTTNSKGLFEIPNIKIGERIILVDFTSNKEFELVVVHGRKHYDFDITRYSNIKVSAKIAGTPLVGEMVNIEYCGETHSAQTNILGIADITLPYIEHEPICVRIKDQKQNAIINVAGNELFFEFSNTPQAGIEVVVRQHGEIAAGRNINIHYGDQSFDGTTDENGIYRTPVSVIDNQPCEVNVEGYDTQARVLVEDQNNIFIFDNVEEEVVVPTPTNKIFSPELFIIGEDNYIGSNYRVKIEYKGVTTEYQSDENGKIALDDMEDGAQMVVTDTLHENNIETYVLNADIPEYIFHIPSKAVKKQIKVWIYDYLDKPMKCDNVHFHQEETSAELTAILDDEGCTSFAPETFQNGKDITVTINGNSKVTKPFVFTIEDGEFEYILQELKPKTDWGMIILQIVFILLFIILMAIIWIFHTQLCSEIYDLIYN